MQAARGIAIFSPILRFGAATIRIIPILGKVARHYEIDFAARQGQMTGRQRAELNRIVRKHDGLMTAYIASCANPNRAIAKRRMRNVRAFVRRLGLPVKTLPQAIHAKRRNCVTLTFTQKVIVTPKCPDITTNKSTYKNIASNFGCSSARNLALMLADPNDLLAKSGTNPVSAKVVGDAVQRYKDDKVKKLFDVDTTA